MIPYLVHPFQEIKVTQKNQRWLNTDGAVSVPVEAVTTLSAASLGQSHYSRGEERCFGRPEADAVQQRYLVKGWVQDRVHRATGSRSMNFMEHYGNFHKAE